MCVGVHVARNADESHRLLDSKDATSLEYKLESFSAIYQRLTGLEVKFEFPVVSQDNN